MVQTDISQLSAECTEWRQILRNYRDELQESKKSLESICRKDLERKNLQDVEHFDNQFHIQLINIHDLKQFIKAHQRKIGIESSSGETIGEETYTEHEALLDQFISLVSTLQDEFYFPPGRT